MSGIRKEGDLKSAANMRKRKSLEQLNTGGPPYTSPATSSIGYLLVSDDLWDHARSEVTSDTTVRRCCSQNTPSLELTLLPT